MDENLHTKNINENKKWSKKLVLPSGEGQFSNGAFKMLFDNSPTASFICKPAGKVITANVAACSLFGYTVDEFCELSYSSLFENGKAAFNKAGTKTIELKASKGNINAIKKNADKFLAAYETCIFEDGDQSLVCIIINKISGQMGTFLNMDVLMDNTEESFVLVDKYLNITAYNKSAQEYHIANLGIPLETGRSVLDYAEPERKEIVREIYKNVFDGKRQESIITFPTPNDQKKILHITFNPVRNEQEEIIGAFIIVREITKETQRLEELERTKAELDRIMSGSLDMICTIAYDDTILKISAASEPILGYRPDELVGKNLFDFLYPEDLGKTKKTANNVVKKKGSVANFNNRYRHKNGSLVYLEWTATWHKDEKVRYGIGRNVTEKVLAEQKLLQSEQRFKSLVQDGSDLIGILDAEANYQYVSPTSYTLLGYRPEEFIGKNAFDFMHPDDKEIVFKDFSALTLNKKLNLTPFRFKHKNGTWRWIETTITNLLDEPAVRGIVANSRDITERKHLEEKILYEQQEKELLINATEDLIWSVNCDLKLIAANKSFIKNIEINTGNTLKPGDDIVLKGFPEEFLRQWQSYYSRALQGESFRVEIYSSYSRDNSFVWTETVFNPIYNNKEIIGIACYSRDITERKNIEEKLKQSEAFLSEAQRLAKMGSWNFDFLKDKLTWSDELYRVFGTDKKTFNQTHKSFVNLIDEADRELVKKISKHAQLTGEPFNIQYHITTPTGLQRVIEEFGYGEKDETGKVIRLFGTAQDITERKAAEEEENFKAKLLNTIGQAAIATDLNGTVTYWNHAAEIMYGWTAEEVIGQNILDLTPTEQTKEQATEIMKSMTRGNSWSGEFMVKRKNGQSFPALVNDSPIYDQNGNLSGIIGISSDITELKKAEQSLMESNLRYEYVTKATFDAIWDWDIEGKMIYWGDAYKKLFGKMDETGLSELEMVRNRLHPEEVEKVLASAVNALKSNINNWNYEHRYLKPDGTYAFVSNRAFIIRNQAGQAIRITGAMHDISQRKEREEQLILLESVIVNSNDAVIITEAQPIDEPGPRIIYVNEAFSKMAGYTTAELIGNTPRILQGPKSDRAELDKLKRAMQKSESCEITIINYKKSGEEFYINFSVNPVANENGYVTHFISIERDVTEQKKAEETIRSQKERYDLASIATSDIIWDWNLVTHEVIRSKEAVKKLFGFSDQEHIDNAAFWANRVHPNDKVWIEKKFKEFFADHNAYFMDYEYRFKKADGSYAYIKDKGFIIRDEQGRPIRMIGAAQDITKLRENEIQLQQANADLEKRAKELDYSNKELEQFAYIASHDLQEPLRMVTSFLTQINKKYESVLDESGKKYIHFAVDGAKRMRQIILDLLEYSRVGKLVNEAAEVDLNDLMKEIQILYRRQVQDKKATISYKNLPVIEANRTPIRQVFQNLVANALLYSREDIPPKIKITGKDKITHWEFAVADNGIGINKEYFEKIFIIFQRLHSREHFAGTGMGLALTKKIVENMDGKIWLKSEEGKGSIFYFTIPKN